ncbi:MAG: M28 family peptidase [Promethearchaeota archaeon]|nr:MAG: M28 family peptidase [Candidatus Lokiarchaeota archaeon]
MLRLYNEEAAINHVKTLSFKRHAATEGEIKVVNYLVKELGNEKINFSVETFEWTKTMAKILKLFFLWIFLFVLICQIISLYPIITWSFLIVDGIFIFLSLLGIRYIFDHSRIIYFGKKRESKNVIATVQAKDLYAKRPVIIFSAHHDSAGSIYPIMIIKFLYLLGALLLLLYLIFTIILSIWSILSLFSITQINFAYFLIRNLFFITGLVILVELIFLLFNKKVDTSIGSIDNATGVSILLELAKLIKKNPLEKTDVIFVWFGAEEMGLWGSKQYYFKHFEELIYNYELNKSFNINIDMVGSSISIEDEIGLFRKRKMNENLNDILEISANQQKINLKKVKTPIGSGSDHLVIKAFTKKVQKKNFQVSCFFSREDTKYIHSQKDTPEKCSTTNLNGCIDICYNAIRSLDLRVESLRRK